MALRSAVLGRDLLTSRVAAVEVSRACARANPAANAQAVLALMSFVELDAELAAVAAATGDSRVRALDAIHVASGLRLGAAIEWFITYDQTQAAAAKAVGLPVSSPGEARPTFRHRP